MINLTQSMKWEPYSGPLPEQPFIGKIQDGLAKGLNFNAAAWGVSAGKSLDRLQKAVERRNPWRKDGETVKRLRSYELAKLSRQAINSYTPRIDHALDSLLPDYHDGVLVHAAGTFHAPAMPYITELCRKAVAVNGLNRSVDLLENISSDLTLTGSIGRFSLTSSNEVLDEFSNRLASRFAELFASGVHFLDEETLEPNPLHLRQLRAMLDDIQAYLGWSHDDVLDMCLRYGHEPMESRLSDFVWVRRRLRRFKALKTADFYRAYGFVHKNAEPVIADQVLSDRKHARERNAKTLQNTIIYNKADMDEWLTLFSVSAASVSNPELRRIEMMVRLKGFESLADKAGHQALFLTFTTPSRFHAYHSAGSVNDKWLNADKPTVKAASDWLTSAWAEIRTDLKDAGIRVYGFRFVEPHHDGCPHWHLVLFMEPTHCKPLISICRNRLLPANDPDSKEAGAAVRRFKAEYCDKNKGSAVAYCAAYIAKNLDGKSLDSHDETDKPMNDMVQRVDAWRSAHNIRQFAQIGGPSVTAWRELRRCRNEFNRKSDMFSDLTQAEFLALENVRRAADAGDFEEWVIAMGGVTVKRADQTIRVQYGTPEAWEKVTENAVDKLFGNIEKIRTRYGDIAKESITGFIFRRVYVCTRTKEWSTSDKNKFLATVRDQFDVLEHYEEYIRMQDEQYEAMMAKIDEAESRLEKTLVFVENALNADFIDYLDSPAAIALDDFDFWGEAPLDLCH